MTLLHIVECASWFGVGLAFASVLMMVYAWVNKEEK